MFFFRSQGEGSSKSRRLIWPKAIRLNGNVPIEVMPNGLDDARMAAVSKPSSPSTRVQAFEDLVISVLFVIVNSLRVALRTKLLCDQQGHTARRSRGGNGITVPMHGYIGHRSIIGRTSQRIRDAELQLFPCDLGDGRGFDEDIHLLAGWGSYRA